MTDKQIEERVARLLEECPPAETPPESFWARQFDLGLAWVSFPEGLGGLGLPAEAQRPVDLALAAAGAPTNFVRNPIGVGMAAPTLVAHGTPEQQRRFLRPMFTGEEVWCQLFSEPGAGSDLANLSTRAVRDGDVWVVNGQKVWTTLAHLARWAILVARTDPSKPKHRGLSYFVVDMEAAGVEVRPLRQATGDAEFNEVYLTDVEVPDDMRVGEVGEGWRVAMATLMNERVSLGGAVAPRGSGPIAHAVGLWESSPDRTPARRDELAQLWIEAEVNRLTNLRAQELRERGTPGPEGSIGKLASAELNKRIYELCLRLQGPEGMLHPGYRMLSPDEAALAEHDVARAFLRVRANSIEGGTSEILRNILGERVLGLPPEPRVDKDVPFSETRRA